jgi:hypothetical protein
MLPVAKITLQTLEHMRMANLNHSLRLQAKTGSLNETRKPLEDREDDQKEARAPRCGRTRE